MPRQARIVFPNLPHYITQWGNRREDVFFTDDQRKRYLAWLKEYSDRHGVEVLAYCLMSNQIHLVAVPRTEEALQRVLRPLHTRFAQRLNREQGWKGHVWHGRFSSSALDNVYMLAAIRYVERYPVRVKLVRKAERYRWSSAAAHCGLTEDAVLTKKRQWQRKMEQTLDWAAWLAEADNPEQLEVISTHVERGLPCGLRQFIKKLERLSGQVLEYRPRGRPKKVK